VAVYNSLIKLVRRKALYSIFFLGVLLFVAKPFIGFAAISANPENITSSSILVKAFSKRKPEDLRDAELKKAALRNMLMDPPVKLLISIAFLMSVLFPLSFRSAALITGSYLNRIRYSLIPAAQPYLLTGKLSI
jgi:hypothetical protein